MNNEPERLYSKFAREVLTVGAATALTTLSGIFFLPFITKTLGAHDYGIWAQVQSTVSLTSGVLCLGLPYALVRFLPAKTDRAEIRDDFYSVLCLTSLVSLPFLLIMVLSADHIARTFFDGDTGAVIIAGVLTLLQVVTYAYLYYLRAFRNVVTFCILNVAAAYAKVGLVAYLALSGRALSTMLMGSLAIQAAVVVVLFSLVWRQMGIGWPRFHNVKAYLRFALPTVPGNISWWLISLTDRYVIAYVLGATSVGIYSAAYALGSIVMLVVGILGFVLAPAMSKLYDEGYMTELATHLTYSLKYLLLLGIPFVFGTMALSEPILTLFSTPAIAAEGHQIVPLIAASILLYGAFTVISTSLALAKKTALSAVIVILAAVANLALNVLLVPHFGIIGSAVGILIAYALLLVMGAYYSFKEVKFPIPWSSILKSLIASTVMGLVVWLMHPESRSETIVAVLAGIGLYGVLIVLLKGISKEEISFFSRLVRPGSTKTTATSDDDKFQ